MNFRDNPTSRIHNSSSSVLSVKKNQTLLLFLYFSNMVNLISQKFLAVFVTTQLQHFLITFGFSNFFCMGYTACAPKGREGQSQGA